MKSRERRTALLIATLDTKGAEIAFVRELIAARGHDTLLLDAGVLGEPSVAPDVSAAEVARAGGSTLEELRARADRGEALAVMARGAAAIASRLHTEGAIHGVVGIGGSCGTTIGTAAMRELPVGVPKVMVSTLASGQVSHYVGVKDVTMLHSVVDIAGLNRISRLILANAAGAVAGMLEQELSTAQDRPVVAATMFGVTTTCVERLRMRLEASGYEVLVFHATGSGGRAMEGLIAAGLISAVADVTTTELADELVGGVLSAGPDRMGAAARAGIPQVVSVGALDMVNFGPRDTVPAAFAGRRLHVHNPSVTLMRTTVTEMASLGRTIAEKVNAARGPVRVFVPLRGVSAIDKEGAGFHDADADAALFQALRDNVRPPVELVELDMHINDAEFADAMAAALTEDLERSEHAVHSA